MRSDGDFETSSECILELPACPFSDVSADLMKLSVPIAATIADFGSGGPWAQTASMDMNPPPWDGEGVPRYPEFCEDWVPIDGTDPDLENRCTDLTGHAVTSVTARTGTYCRVLTPIECPAFTATDSGGSTFGVAMHRIGAQSCRVVQRRSWTCDSTKGYRPSNAFNSCYLAQSFVPGQHPACGQGTPDFPLGPSAEFLRQHPNSSAALSQLACAEFVGDDFLIDPTERNCIQHFLVPLVSGSSDYWCEYDSGQLRVECHQLINRPTDCSGTPAYCIKRASRTGGCDQIAHTILCRAFQAEFSRNNSTIQEFQEQEERLRAVQEFLSVPVLGCNPCQHLPFSELPSRCTAADTSGPRSSPGVLDRVLAVKRDFDATLGTCRSVTSTAEYEADAACRARSVCADPPRGRITWTSQHQSGLAIVNSRVEVSVLDIPLEQRRTAVVFLNVGTGDPRNVSFVSLQHYRHQHYTDATTEPGSISKATTLHLGDDSRQFDLDSWPTGSSECFPRDNPYFDLMVEELWPDSADGRTEILELFGSDSLDWWDNLDNDDQESRTAARGLGWWNDLDSNQREARRAELTVQIQCVRNNYTVCDWTPTRSGYFKLTAAGAWIMKYKGVRRWWSSYNLGSKINEALERSDIKAETERLIAQQGLMPEQLGIDPSDPNEWKVLGLNPACGEDRRWVPADCLAIDAGSVLFDEEHASTASCEGLDQRVRCIGHESYNYTETEPVGLIVHEVQTRTVATVARN